MRNTGFRPDNINKLVQHLSTPLVHTPSELLIGQTEEFIQKKKGSTTHTHTRAVDSIRQAAALHYPPQTPGDVQWASS